MGDKDSAFVAPGSYRSLRACMICSIVQPERKFQTQGCPNCEEFLQMAGSIDTVRDCTSQVFEGMITLANPESSWVARWQRLSTYVPGVYATKVAGEIPENIRDAVEAAGVAYIPRDGTAADEVQEEA